MKFTNRLPKIAMGTWPRARYKIRSIVMAVKQVAHTSTRSLALLIPLLFVAGPAFAIPRYSALYEQNCSLCHMNPTGGGQRSPYAAQQLIPAEISATRLSPEQMSSIDPQIGKNLSIGCDLRTIEHVSDKKGVGYDNFLQMQGSIYLTFQMNPRFLAYLNQGMSGTSELFGVGSVLRWNGYIKVGRFKPPFGWKFGDHTMFVRQKPLEPATNPGALPGGAASDLGLGGGPPLGTDVGLETAIFPKRLALTLAVTNGNLGSTLDNNDHPAVTGQGFYRLRLGGIGMGLGGSFWRNSEFYGARTAVGPLGYLKWGKWIWLGEVDWSRLKFSQTYLGQFLDPLTGQAIDRVTSRTISQELSWIVRRGFTAVGTFDFFDPDQAEKTGSRSRYGVGIEYMPYPFLVLHALVNSHRFDQGKMVAGRNYTQMEVQAHILY